VAQRCARSYLAGPALADARRAIDRLRGQGSACTVGYFNADTETPRAIADAGLAALGLIASERFDGQLSVKAPALRYDAGLIGELARAAAGSGVTLIFDAHAPEDADRTFAAMESAAAAGASVGAVLPGRWWRSVADATRLRDRPVRVRIVKGQWADPSALEVDSSEGFLAVVDALAGRAAPVAVATHDPVLAREALLRLRAAGTPCELELLFGLPTREPARAARALAVPLRVYVPYGTAWLPYALGQALRRPQVLFWVVRDAALGFFRPG
jgi:proline dehydrogenase